MDYALYSIINGIAGKSIVLDKAMVVIAQYSQYLFGVILVLFWFRKDVKEKVMANRKAAIISVLTMLIAVGVNHLIGLVYFRPRPYTLHPAHLLISPSTDPSFPSDHAAFAFALTFPVLLVNKKIGWIMTIMSGLLVFSRVFVGIHYPFDVIGGSIIAYITYKITHKYPKYFDLTASFITKAWDTIINKHFNAL